MGFVESSHKRLLIDSIAIELLLKRGLTIETIQKNKLGWNPIKFYIKRFEWGVKETTKCEWFCLPKGLIIPSFQNNAIDRLKIRKSEWSEGDPYGKYYEVPGSSSLLPIYGSSTHEIAVIVEAEFDAMLVTQEAGDLCYCIALGGAQKRPNPTLHQTLLSKKLLLFGTNLF
jgi:hypothetical protein